MSVHPMIEVQVGKLLAMSIGQAAAASTMLRHFDREDAGHLADRIFAAVMEIESVYEILVPEEV